MVLLRFGYSLRSGHPKRCGPAKQLDSTVFLGDLATEIDYFSQALIYFCTAH